MSNARPFNFISHGVPQGSILGPALFNIYINDLPSVPKVGSLECYVDDSQLYLSFPVHDATLAADQLTEDLQSIAAWCCNNSLLINPDKTKLLVPVVQKLDSAIHRINHYPADTYYGKQLRYPLDSDLSAR